MTVIAVEAVADELDRLARECQRMRLADRDLPARVHGTPRRKDIYLSGYLSGLSLAIGKLTGQAAMEVEASIIAEVGAELGSPTGDNA